MLAVFTVTNLDDLPVFAPNAAPGTLRQALFDANSAPGQDTIEFQSGLTGTLKLYERAVGRQPSDRRGQSGCRGWRGRRTRRGL